MAPTPRQTLRTPRATRTKQPVSYTEPPSDSDLDLDDTDSSEDSAPSSKEPARRKTRTRPRKRHRALRPDHHDDRERASKKPKHLVHNPEMPTEAKAIQKAGTSGVIPPWMSLPYQVLVQIFQYAAYPLYDPLTFQPLGSGSWLLKVARICRSFAEPALTALYTSPPLVPMDKAHMLVDLLQADPAALAFKYRQKIESLRIDVGQVAAYSLPGSGHLDLFALIKDLPRLVELELYHQKDMSPFRSLEESIKWTLPESLFAALEYVDPNADSNRGDKTCVCSLKSWRWSSRLAGKKYPLTSIREIHLKPSFASLRKIAFVNYQVPPTKKGDESPPSYENILADTLSVLSNLEHLIFESSTLVNSKLLPLLPKGLRHLDFINCSALTADHFEEFLLTHGSQLRSLNLNHNHFLGLSFLPSLGSACPHLQVLRMNLTYFNLHSTSRDSEPQYEYLLLPSEVPVWPSTLQAIELFPLRKWEVETANMFFQGLLDSAAALPNLRRLTIQAILDIGWRDRATFRDKWVGSLDRVFKRSCDPPRHHFSVAEFSSIAGNTAQELYQQDQDIVPEGIPPPRPYSSGSSHTNSDHTNGPSTAGTADAAPPRRSARTRTRQAQRGRYAETSDDSGGEGESEQAAKASHQQRRLRQRFTRELAMGPDSPLPEIAPPDTSQIDTEREEEVQERRKHEFIQGMCEVVDIRIDNLRPRETKATEADFLDEEAPGDADWDGDDDVEESYAW